MKVFHLESKYSDIWIGYNKDNTCDYHYGGTRLVNSTDTDSSVVKSLKNLILNESQLKNRLINHYFSDTNIDDNVENSLLQKVKGTKIGGARCLIRPKSQDIHDALFNKSPQNDFEKYINDIFSIIGRHLNDMEGDIKLTPDFGRFADLSDYLYKHTEHVLGISCDSGGCGGKSSYSTRGIIGGLNSAGLLQNKGQPLTLIGSCGAMGSDLLTYLSEADFNNFAVSDLQYDDGTCSPPSNVKHLSSEIGKFTDDALSRGGIIIATTWGHELIASNINSIPEGTTLVLAHNYSLPEGDAGKCIENLLNRLNIKVYPGQLLTLGGALTSRLEWYSRQSNLEFDKELASEVAEKAVFSLNSYFDSNNEGKSIYNNILEFNQ